MGMAPHLTDVLHRLEAFAHDAPQMLQELHALGVVVALIAAQISSFAEPASPFGIDLVARLCRRRGETVGRRCLHLGDSGGLKCLGLHGACCLDQSRQLVAFGRLAFAYGDDFLIGCRHTGACFSGFRLRFGFLLFLSALFMRFFDPGADVSGCKSASPASSSCWPPPAFWPSI